MDPNAALTEIRTLVTQNHASDEDHPWEDESTDRLVELVEGLDEWLSKDGFLPDDWRSDDDKASEAPRHNDGTPMWL